MALIATPNTGSRRRRRGRRGGPINEINMTPFIDVMLVLLIIFMVTAPLMTSGVPLNLPKTGAAPVTIETKPVSVDIDAEGRLFFESQEVSDADIVAKLATAAKSGFDERILVRGDKAVDYGRIMQIMTILTNAGYKRVVMVTRTGE